MIPIFRLCEVYPPVTREHGAVWNQSKVFVVRVWSGTAKCLSTGQRLVSAATILIGTFEKIEPSCLRQKGEDPRSIVGLEFLITTEEEGQREAPFRH